MGIAKLVVTPFLQPGGNPNDTSQRFLMDNLRFEAIVPEPSAALLFPTGLLLAAHGLRRRRVRA